MENEGLISEQDLIAKLNITRASLWRHRKAGLKHYRIGRRVYYSIDAIKEYMPNAKVSTSNYQSGQDKPECLTKREYFAGLAMQGLLANSSPHFARLEREDVVIISILYADELINQLNK